MPRPFVAYLRVYEPLAAFDPVVAARLRKKAESDPLSRESVGERERELWLRSQLASPVRMLPGELPDGRPAPNASLDVLVVNPAEVPTGESSSVGPGPLVCPLDMRPRSAAALSGFLSTSWGALRDAALGNTADHARDHVSQVMSGDIDGGTVHMLSSTWTVPLPWFALFEPEDRHIVLGPQNDSTRAVYWRSAMADVRRRVARAHAVTKDTLGTDGPAAVLRETGRWLENFHPHSAVELDYGGLVQLLGDNELLTDTSAQDVHAIVDAMDAGDAEEIAGRYERLRDFWGELAARERFN